MYEAKQIIFDILSTLHFPYPINLPNLMFFLPCLSWIYILLSVTNYNYLLIKLLFTMNDFFFFQNTNLMMSFPHLKPFSDFLQFLWMKILTLVNKALI